MDARSCTRDVVSHCGWPSTRARPSYYIQLQGWKVFVGGDGLGWSYEPAPWGRGRNAEEPLSPALEEVEAVLVTIPPESGAASSTPEVAAASVPLPRNDPPHLAGASGAMVAAPAGHTHQHHGAAMDPAEEDVWTRRARLARRCAVVCECLAQAVDETHEVLKAAFRVVQLLSELLHHPRTPAQRQRLPHGCGNRARGCVPAARVCRAGGCGPTA